MVCDELHGNGDVLSGEVWKERTIGLWRETTDVVPNDEDYIKRFAVGVGIAMGTAMGRTTVKEILGGI